MKRKQIILLVVAVLVVAGLFMLPRAAVEKKETPTASTAAGSAATPPMAQAMATAEADEEELPLPDESKEEAKHPEALRMVAALDAPDNNAQVQIQYADSLQSYYLGKKKYYLAAKYAARKARLSGSIEDALLTANHYYEAYNLMADPAKGKPYIQQARKWYKAVLDKKPHDSPTKIKLALTYVASENPMQGIFMLREVLQQDPENRDALYQMGILSMQTGQFDKACRAI